MLDGDTAIVVGFLKLDGTLGSALLSDQPEIELNLICEKCTPSSLKRKIIRPLVKIPTESIRVLRGTDDHPPQASERPMLTIRKDNPDGKRAMFPYAELVIEKDE